MNSKTIRRIIITLTIILSICFIAINSVLSAGVFFEISSYLKTNKNGNYITYTGANNNDGLLGYQNVFCVEHGADFNGGFDKGNTFRYNVGGTQTFSTSNENGQLRILAHILYKASQESNSGKDGWYKRVGQIALWKWIEKNSAWSAAGLGAEYIGKIGDYSASGYTNEQAEALYSKYISDIPRSSNETPYINNLRIEDGNLKGTVSGCSKYYLYVNNVQIGGERTGDINIPISSLTLSNDGKYNVVARGVYTVNTVTYMQLNHDAGTKQNLIVVTNQSQSTVTKDSTPVSINGITDVSLQKYITKVTNSQGKVTYQDDIERKNKYADLEKNIKNQDDGNYSTGKHDGKNVAKNETVSGDNNYKSANPVIIGVGDTVEYTIKLYNNSDVPSQVPLGDRIRSTYTEYIQGKGYNVTAKYITKDGQELDCGLKATNGINHTYYLITYDWNSDGQSEEYVQLGPNEEKTFKVYIKYNKYTAEILENVAWIWGNTVPTNKTEYRILDADYIKMQQYEVSLEKYISSVNGVNIEDRSGKAEYLTADSYGGAFTQRNLDKYNNVVTVKNGDYVTYTIKATNDSKYIPVYITEIIDYLPENVLYKIGTYSENDTIKSYNERPENGQVAINRLAAKYLEPGESITVYITVRVEESNMSLNILKNTAKITKIKGSNDDVEQDADIYDATPGNNQDSDYIQMDNINLSGFVWNDIAWDKKQINYNGLYEADYENPLSDIPVFLYRNGQEGIKGNVSTDKDGKYEFTIEKGPKVNGTNRWEGTYYSYSVVFGYDGITYTPTTLKDGQNCLGIYNNDYNDSNAQENEKVREDFNKKFATINNENRIEYSTKNESGYMPESNHISNEDMKTWAYTNDIELENTSEREEQLKHVNLGLRGRDIFDLELTTDVHSTQVTVNGIKGVYQYSNNKVVLRREDLSNSYNHLEDMANTYAQKARYAGESYDQGVRKIDINSTELNIEVTYKITVQNVSKTDGTATVITDYFDNKYDFIKAYVGNYEMTIENKKATYGNSGTGYKSVVLTTPATNLTQNDTMEIFVVFKLSNANNLKDLLNGAENLPTFNIAEITEYTTRCANGQTEFTRGLIDKDSAPGSINKEKVRLANGTSNLTTLNYYYQKAQAFLNDRTNKDLNNLKYEDDTCAAPILYFTASDQERTLTGTVFEDKTSVNNITKIKTGNGKLDEGEVGIYGAIVELIEQKENGATHTTSTNKDGRFEFSGFLPGNYIIKYHYGNTTNTVLLHQGGENVNKQSYNGEDYQATNNKYKIDNMDTNQLNTTPNFWYVYNENDKISTATDNVERRNLVTENVLAFSDADMTILNNMRDMVGTYNKDTDTLTSNKKYNINKTELLDITETKITGIKDIIDKTSMFATTDTMLFTVEETVDLNKLENKDLLLAENKVTIIRQDNEKGILLGEWAIFPDNSENSPYKSYTITDINFGIAEVPVTTIDLQKEVKSFTITDSTGNNIIASVSKDESGEWKLKGDVLPLESTGFDISIEDEKLQGARLEITYEISSQVIVTKNFDQTNGTVATINGLIDYIDNNLSYNENLGENSRYWEPTTYNEIFTDDNKGIVDPEGNKYTTIVKAKSNNPILKNLDYATATITLEKVLSSTNSTFEDIVTSTVDIYAYNNIVEITELNYGNVTSENPGEDPGSNPGGSNPDETVDVRKDLIRTPDRYIPIAKKQHDTATSGIVTIHPPTGDNSLSINYYIITVIVLAIIAAGAYGIKKFVVKK